MPLTHDLSAQVSLSVRTKGLIYYQQKRVNLVLADAKQVQAEVRGSNCYQVYLTQNGKTLKVFCTCPYFQDTLCDCKHIWATLLEAESKGYLAAKGPLEIDVDEDFLENEWHDTYEEEWSEESGRSRKYTPIPRRKDKKPAKPKEPSWGKDLAQIRSSFRVSNQPASSWSAPRELLYFINVAESKDRSYLVLQTNSRERTKTGAWSKPRVIIPTHEILEQVKDAGDRRILGLLAGTEYADDYGYSYYGVSARSRFHLRPAAADALVPLLCQTGRCFLRDSRDSEHDEDKPPLSWQEGAPHEFWLTFQQSDKDNQYHLQGELRQESARRGLAEPILCTKGLVFWPDSTVGRLQDFGAGQLLNHFRGKGKLLVPNKDKERFVAELLQLPFLPRLDMPAELCFEEVRLTPRPRVLIKAPDRRSYGPERLTGRLSFDYDGHIVEPEIQNRAILQAEQKRLILRDQDAEAQAASRLNQLGFRTFNYQPGLQLAATKLPKVVRSLLTEGWHVEAEGKLYRQPGSFSMEVTSGIDWFELHGSVEYGDTTAQLPALLEAVRKGDTLVPLDDGTFGMLPEAWLKKYGLLAGVGTAEKGHVRFAKNQVGLLDALLAAQPEITCDAVFEQARTELRNFKGISSAQPAASFQGQLRPYQGEGLGWLQFLRKFGFGGCLADDMGLGKTVQVLALLDSLRQEKPNGKKRHASLLVVPRSLVFNWIQEAQRFTPKLRLLDHTGIDRLPPGPHFHDHDVVLTTYGTLRRNVVDFKDQSFEYCILDESQAVKNASSDTAKAVRLVRCRHRLAMSGTPIENHLGELWSLFEFLNPGMLGTASVFRLGTGSRTPDEDSRQLLAGALRPFILRRTKAQVATDLPEKLEQTLWCELEPEQRKHYDELRNHYRQMLLGKIERDGINKAKIEILEALLRLRQAACHPGLIDKKRTGKPSAKLDMLLPQLQEVLEEGHKTLVFSQFTSFLAILCDRLKMEKIPFEYLDGKTRDRQARVEHFQNDPDCKLFLISLKAGGLGLNLTAAEYVFLLDPWWNPAVEAQAIDRAHRIGQTQRVFAYRLIARDTVEEKVLELQQKKRALADAIINEDNSLIRTLGKAELEMLLS